MPSEPEFNEPGRPDPQPTPPYAGVPPIIGNVPPKLSEFPPGDGGIDRGDWTSSEIFRGRLHPMTLLFNVWGVVKSFIIPAVILLVVGNAKFVGFMLLMFVFIPLVLSTIRYFTFTYRIEGGELITKQGLLGRTERHIRLQRVQDIRVEQGVLHRMLGMADVNVETAGGQGAEASLSVLSMKDAERLREAVFEHAAAARRAEGVVSETGAAEIAPEELVIRELSLRELILAGLTSNQTASVMAFLAVGFNLLDDVFGQEAQERAARMFGNTIERFFQNGGHVEWMPVVLGVAAVFLVGLIFSVVGSVIMFYGFKLSLRGEDLHRAYGLFTRRSSSLPRRRIQVLKVEEKPLRRLFHLATLRADTAGSRVQRGEENTGGRDMLLPVVPRGEVESLLPVFFPDLDAEESEWRKVSRRAIWRGTVKGAAVCLILTCVFWGVRELGMGRANLGAPTSWFFGSDHEWSVLWPLALIPLVLLLNVMSYRHLGYQLGEKFFRTRRGWLSRGTHIVPIRNTQAIIVRRTPFDRRHRVGSLIVDTAGQAYTGGAPRIDNVHWQQALETARVLAHRAAETRYRV